MKGKEQRAYIIHISSLKNGEHRYDFEVADSFFARFEERLVDKGKGQVSVKLVKSETMMDIHLNLDITVELICDRSLDPFKHAIKVEHEIIVKFGAENTELSEDVLMIERDTAHFDLAPLIHEFVGLAIPMKKLHPRYENEETPDMIYQSAPDTEENAVDPRWDALKKLNKK